MLFINEAYKVYKHNFHNVYFWTVLSNVWEKYCPI